jgi:hypothetical protein
MVLNIATNIAIEDAMFTIPFRGRWENRSISPVLPFDLDCVEDRLFQRLARYRESGRTVWSVC